MDEFCNVTELIVRRRLWLLDGWCGSVWQEWASLNYFISSTVKSRKCSRKRFIFLSTSNDSTILGCLSKQRGGETDARLSLSDFVFSLSTWLSLYWSDASGYGKKKKKKGCLREKLKIKKAVQPIREQTASLQGDTSSELESHLLRKKKKFTQLPSDDCHSSVALTSPRSCR